MKKLMVMNEEIYRQIMIRGNNICGRDVVGVMKLVLITTVAKIAQHSQYISE